MTKERENIDASYLSANKDSPLTEIATSPPPFDLTMESREEDLEAKNSGLQNNTRVADKVDGATHDKESYESSELSDLGDDNSEAETEKMDFLEESARDGEGPVLDLKVLSALTSIREKESSKLDDGATEGEEAPGIGNENSVGDGARDLNGDDVQKDDADSRREHTNTSVEPKEEEEIGENSAGSKKHKSKAEDSEPIDEVDSRESSVKKRKLENSVTDEPDKGLQGSPDGTALARENASGLESNKNSGEESDGSDENDDEIKQERKNGTDEAADEEDIEDNVAENANVAPENNVSKQSKLAVEELISIETAFALLRDKLYKDKLELLEHELQLCLDGSHPELSKVYHKVNQFHRESMKQANANLTYRLRCIDIETVATRTSIHQNFLKKLMDTRNDMISDVTYMWYKINKERNQMDQVVPDFNFSAIPKIPNYTIPAQLEEDPAASSYSSSLTKKIAKQNTLVELVQHRNNVNQQLGILNGLVQFHGFPCAIASGLNDDDQIPSLELLLKSATNEEILEDLKSMGYVV